VRLLFLSPPSLFDGAESLDRRKSPLSAHSSCFFFLLIVLLSPFERTNALFFPLFRGSGRAIRSLFPFSSGGGLSHKVAAKPRNRLKRREFSSPCAGAIWLRKSSFPLFRRLPTISCRKDEIGEDLFSSTTSQYVSFFSSFPLEIGEPASASTSTAKGLRVDRIFSFPLFPSHCKRCAIAPPPFSPSPRLPPLLPMIRRKVNFPPLFFFSCCRDAENKSFQPFPFLFPPLPFLFFGAPVREPSLFLQARARTIRIMMKLSSPFFSLSLMRMMPRSCLPDSFFLFPPPGLPFRCTRLYRLDAIGYE